MSDVVDGAPERLIKSAERVRDLGEVFTPRRIVDDMLDLLPAEAWEAFPPATFLEPACGDGNFLVAVLERKLDRVAEAWDAGLLPAGRDVEALWFHGLAALSSVYGVDISADNIIGGSPEHPVGARKRVLAIFIDWVEQVAGSRPASKSRVVQCARSVVSANLIVGDMLPVDASGRARSLDGIELVEYRWVPSSRKLAIVATTMQQVIDAARESAAEQPSLFGTEELDPLWSGSFLGLHRLSTVGQTDDDVDA